ncbi:hypothetical protein GWK47_026478 [Chionoecetes opilio]|uniref:Uncharacterized protein n=1 Tax=Chionoecetes opilio TaxID=41210 RepID=A0A8J8WCD7_CHIOP|nr:hypothetical protein GWK47_026478 [Chionoecetes opilio]
MAAAGEFCEGLACGGEGVVSGGEGVVSGVNESHVAASVLERERRVEGEFNGGGGGALKSLLEAIEDLKMRFLSEVNESKSVVKKQELEIRSLKCKGVGPSGLSGGAHARDVPGGVPEGGIPEENTELVDMCADVRRLPILEALYIKDINPKLNVQANDLQALPSMKRKKANNSLLTEKPSEDQTTNQRHPLKKTRSKSYLPITGAANRLRGRQTGYK